MLSTETWINYIMKATNISHQIQLQYISAPKCASMASCKLANREEKWRGKKKEIYILKIEFTETSHD